MFDSERRQFLKNALTIGATGLAIGSGLLTPQMLFAAWPKTAFEAKELTEALVGLYGNETLEDSSAIDLKAPDMAENGAVVPITVETNLSEVTHIALIAPANTNPLICDFVFTPDTVPFISTRIKMGKTGDVVAVVKSNGKLYSTRRTVKVTISGCSG